MITQQHTQESLSRAFVYAVAGMAGVNLSIDRTFDYGIDGTFRPVAVRGDRRVENGIALDFQLKCTTQWVEDEDQIRYDLKAKNFNDMVTREEDAVSIILLLLCIPTEQARWAEFSGDHLILRKCCFFGFMQGEPVQNESSTRRVWIPRANLLTAESLNHLLWAERRRRLGLDLVEDADA